MEKNSPDSTKPQTTLLRPEITHLPRLTFGRRLFRRLLHWLAYGLVWLATNSTVSGLENFPEHGPLLIVTNHLGDADAVLALANFPRQIDALAKAELYDYPVLSLVMRTYGVIWVHRGRPDRRALKAALEGLASNRMIGVAPEGRESITGALEEGTSGAAYLALKSGSPLLPVTFTGTENRIIYKNMMRFKRSPVTITIGKIFTLDGSSDWKENLETATDQIMRTLASQLPIEYQGVYVQDLKVEHANQEH